MAHNKFVTQFKFDTDFPRDHLICTLNFNHTGPTEDLDGLCSDLIAVWDTVWLTTGATPPMRVRSYDNEGAPPVFPNGGAELNWGAAAVASASPREVALCLSYYSERNLPRRRGRVYLPMAHEAGLTNRPSATIRNRAITLGQAFADLGGLDVDWEVWSPTDQAGMSVSNTWCDDEWDTQRRRGLRATTRSLGSPGP
jgi:hypothetical protein